MSNENEISDDLKQALSALTPEQQLAIAKIWKATHELTNNRMMPASEKLPHTIDARIWAKGFIEILVSDPDIRVNEELMIGWFSNAIMAGYDRANNRNVDKGGDNHNPYRAIERSPLEQEEIYFIIRLAEKLPYSKAIKRLTPGYPFSVWRNAIIWIGGWETSELGQWDRGLPAWNVWRDRVDWKVEPRWRAYARRLLAIREPFPLTLFSLITWYGWGIDISLSRIKANWGHLVLSSPHRGELPSKFYWSPNGTPHHPQAKIYWNREPKLDE